MSAVVTAQSGKARILDWENLNPVIEWCYCGKVDPAYLHGRYHTTGMVAWLVLRGSIKLRAQENARTVSAGYWMIFRPGWHRRDMENGTTLISICFKAGWTGQHSLYTEGPPVIFATDAAPQLALQARKLVRFLKDNFEGTDNFLLASETTLPVYMRLQSLFAYWLGTLIETLSSLGVEHTRQGNMDERVRRGLFLIDQLPLERPFSKAALAKNVALSQSQLDRLFIKNTGHTPKNYFDQRRLTQARLGLVNGNQSIKELAYSLGFLSVSHFSTWFHRKEGTAPSSFATSQFAQPR